MFVVINRLATFMVLFVGIFCRSGSCSFLMDHFDKGATQTSDKKSEAQKVQGDDKDRTQLFSMIRNGVVSITAFVHKNLQDRYVSKWEGSGFIVDLEKGLILTNSHVVGEKSISAYEVIFGNGMKASAKIEYIDPCYDFAILSVDPSNIPQSSITLELSDSPVKVNTSIFSMGNSAGNNFSIYDGVVFNIHSICKLKDFPEQSFQFSGLAFSGASGSPVFVASGPEAGKVVGLLYGGNFVSGAALPISYIKPVIDSLKSGSMFKRFFFGAMVDYVSTQELQQMGLMDEDHISKYKGEFQDCNSKILIVTKKIAIFSGGEKLEHGDILWSVNDKLIGPNLQEFDSLIQENGKNDLKITVLRHGKETEVTITPQELDSFQNLKFIDFDETTFFEITPEKQMFFGCPKGVYMLPGGPVSPFSATYSLYDSLYCILNITHINDHEINNLNDLENIIPELYKTEVFTVGYRKFPGDGKTNFLITKHDLEFSEGTRYDFDRKTKSWVIKQISNPRRG